MLRFRRLSRLHPLKLLRRHHNDHRSIVLGDGHRLGPGRVDQFAEVIFRVGRGKFAHTEPLVLTTSVGQIGRGRNS